MLRTVVELSPDEVKYNIFTPQTANIKICNECLCCFGSTTCHLDQTDDIEMLKNEMLKADFIILGSGVFIHNVNVRLSIFLERIGYWTHLMRLAGKRGMVISTSASNGNKFVNEYIWKIMNYMGINVVKCSEWTYNKIVNEKDYEEEIKECAKPYYRVFQINHYWHQMCMSQYSK